MGIVRKKYAGAVNKESKGLSEYSLCSFYTIRNKKGDIKKVELQKKCMVKYGKLIKGKERMKRLKTKKVSLA